MKKETRIVFSVVASLILVATVWALPAKTTHGTTWQYSTPPQESAPAQSVSGKITAVQKHSFTLAVSTGSTSNQKQQLQEATPATPASMIFMIDKNTTVDGKLQVGSNADVTYREENGKNVAISVRVTS